MDGKQTLLAIALAAIGASLCCVDPLLVVTLGIGGAWIATLTQLDPARPVFVALALVLMALARVVCVCRAEVDYGKRQPSVIFDDARVSVDQLARATYESGYPSSIKGGDR